MMMIFMRIQSDHHAGVGDYARDKRKKKVYCEIQKEINPTEGRRSISWTCEPMKNAFGRGDCYVAGNDCD